MPRGSRLQTLAPQFAIELLRKRARNARSRRSGVNQIIVFRKTYTVIGNRQVDVILTVQRFHCNPNADAGPLIGLPKSVLLSVRHELVEDQTEADAPSDRKLSDFVFPVGNFGTC